MGLAAVLGVASYYDWRIREVRDELWMAGGLLGGVLLFLSLAPNSLPQAGLVALVVIFVLQHFFPWDARLEAHPDLILVAEGTLYLVVGLAVVVDYLYGIPGPAPELVSVVVATVLARVLFESGLLYGGADAKAMMTVGLLLPLASSPLLVTLPPNLQYPLIQDIPFAFTALVDGALLTLLVPVAVLGYNLSRGEHELPRALHMYEIPTEELPKRFVWLKDPAPEERPKEDTTAEDEELRKRQAKELLEKGIDRVWVTPQLPFLIAMAAGALIGVLFGDLLLWFVASLP